MIWKPGFTTTLASWIASALTVFLGHHYLPAEVQSALLIATGIITHGHVTAKKGTVSTKGVGLSEMIETLGAQRMAANDPKPLP